MRTLSFVVFLGMLSLHVTGQADQLILKTSARGPYVEHKVAPKENFYSIGRLFNVHPKHIASFNAFDMARGLSIGQTIKIPLSDTNYTHNTDHGIPVYYITGNSETVYNVSTNNKVLMERLRKWNQISSDKLPAGSRLIVGYITGNEAMASAVNSVTGSGISPAAGSADADHLPSKTKKIDDKSAPKKEEVKDTREEVAKTQNKKDEQPVTVSGKQAPKTSAASSDNAQATNPTPGPFQAETGNLSEGFFKTSFDQQSKQQPVSRAESVTAGIFKTSSGWSDGKYYLLMNGVQPGTLVRITNPFNNRTVYAKLLGDMTDLGPDEGLKVRISNAAAAALEIYDTGKFSLKINY